MHENLLYFEDGRNNVAFCIGKNRLWTSIKRVVLSECSRFKPKKFVTVAIKTLTSTQPLFSPNRLYLPDSSWSCDEPQPRVGFHSTKNSGLNFRNFRMSYERYSPPGRTDLVPFPFGHICRQDLLDKMLKDNDRWSGCLKHRKLLHERNLTRIRDYSTHYTQSPASLITY